MEQNKMTMKEKERLVQLLTGKYNIDELSELTTLLKKDKCKVEILPIQRVIPCYFIIRATFRDEEREYEFPTQDVFNKALEDMKKDKEFTDIIWLTGNKA